MVVSDKRLADMLTAAAACERAVRVHLQESRELAGEQARGLAAYRHAVALRRSLEEWVETRAYRARQTELDTAVPAARAGGGHASR